MTGMRYVKLPGGGQMGDLLIPFANPGFIADEGVVAALRACGLIARTWRKGLYYWSLAADVLLRARDRLAPAARRARSAGSRVPLPPARRIVVWLPVLTVLAAQVLRTADVLPDWAADCLEIATVAAVLAAISYIEVKTERTRRLWRAGRPAKALISGNELPAAVPAQDIGERLSAMTAEIASLRDDALAARRRADYTSRLLAAVLNEADAEIPADLDAERDARETRRRFTLISGENNTA